MIGEQRPSGRLDQRTERALQDLRATIAQSFPEAAFTIAGCPDEPRAVHLIVSVDVDDPLDVSDLVRDRTIDLLVDEDISIHIIPVWPVERQRAALNG